MKTSAVAPQCDQDRIDLSCSGALSVPARHALSLSFMWVLGIIHLTLSVLKVARHEMWRDELELWALARESSGLADLMYLYRNRGHPFLWPFCVSLLNQATDNPLAMQLLHVVIATATVLVIIRFAPWGPVHKLAMAFSYYLFFEYNTITRSYALGWLLTFIACALLCSTRRRWGFLAATLFLLAQTSAYGLMVAVAIYAAAVEKYGGESGGQRALRINLVRLAGFSAIVACGALLSVASMTGLLSRSGPATQPSSLDSRSALDTAQHWTGVATGRHPFVDPLMAGRALTRVWRAYVPIPLPQLHFWNTNILEEHRPLQAMLGALLLIAAASMLKRSRPALTLWLVGTVCILYFIYAVFDGFQRHHGHLFLVFLAAWWIREHDAASKISKMWIDRARGVIIGGILCCQVAAGAYASAVDVLRPFSRSRDVARYLSERGDNEIIVGDSDTAGTSVAMWLNRPFYQVASGKFGITIALDSFHQKRPPAAMIYGAAMQIKATHRDSVILLLNHPISPRPGFRLLRKFDGAICASEEYELYEVE